MIVAEIMTVLIYSIVANSLISLASLAGVLTLAVKPKRLQKWLLFLVALSAGAMLGGSFFHLLPEAAGLLPADRLYSLVFIAFAGFFLIEKLLLWHHCHKGKEAKHVFGYMNLIGDGIHNFIDGLIVSATLLTDPKLGLVAIAAIALHEIPQEIGDFGVLVYSGIGRYKALLYNLLIGLTAVLGGIAGYFIGMADATITTYLLPIAAGGFIYIAASDLLPELRQEVNLKKSLTSFAVFLTGVFGMYLLK